MDVKRTHALCTLEECHHSCTACNGTRSPSWPLSPSSSNLHQTQKSRRRVFAMVKGDGEDSYSQNSQVQASFSKVPHSILNEALQRVALPSEGGLTVVADLGSSSGPNTIGNVDLIVETLRLRSPKDAEFQVYFNDLTSNDFNNLFRVLSNDSRANNFFAAGVPGSFYKRLFARSSIHVFCSFTCLHWLSKIPDAVLDKNSPAYNSGNLWIMHSRSAVARAYQQQAARDLNSFLQARAAELVPGGLLFFSCPGRSTSEPNENMEDILGEFCSKDLNEILSDLVEEGLLTEEVRDAVNIPCYLRSVEDLSEAIESCNSLFHVMTAKLHRFYLNAVEVFATSDATVLSRKMRGMHKAVVENFLDAHVGEKLSEEIWQRYEKLMTKKIGLNPQNLKLPNAMCIVSLIRK